MKTKRIYPQEEHCIACGLCRVYCAVEHSRSKDVIKALKREAPKPLPRIVVEEKGVTSFAVTCRHCDEPLCVYACLTGALTKDPATGVVTVDATRCAGCWTCILFCPYGAIVPDLERHVIAKCDLCLHRQQPACVDHCPNEALVVVGAEENA